MTTKPWASHGWQYLTALLAETYARMGRTEEALRMLNKALTQIERTGEKMSNKA